MSSIHLYSCSRLNNKCVKKDTCERYVNANEQSATTLFKFACTELNNYILYIKREEKNNETD